jgi:hypothetical protein
MKRPDLLLSRLNEIGESLSKRESALALIGLGSVGLELDRLDDFSDLDFFAIVKTGSKNNFLNDLSWLTDILPAAYCFKNTHDGYKFLYEDGIFCEFAVFDEDELKQAVFPAGRVVWKAEGVNEDIAIPRIPPQAHDKTHTVEWMLGEALTNLYVGLMREQRGEKLSAMRFIQGYAVDRILELAAQIHKAEAVHPDPFNAERRYEARYPDMAVVLPALAQGYDRNRESALASLNFLEMHFNVSPVMKRAISELCKTINE